MVGVQARRTTIRPSLKGCILLHSRLYRQSVTPSTQVCGAITMQEGAQFDYGPLCLAPPAPSSHAAAPAVVLPSPLALNSVLTTTRDPQHDYYAVAARLKLHSAAPINPYVNATPTDYSIGHVDRFFIANGSVSGYTMRTA